jgi:hypothetical protein
MPHVDDETEQPTTRKPTLVNLSMDVIATKTVTITPEEQDAGNEKN